MYRAARSVGIFTLFSLGFLELANGGEIVGWRGNWTGLWPRSQPPVEWYRLPKGAMEHLRAAASKPSPGDEKAALPVDKGLVREWLVLGPFPVADSVRDFAKPVLPDESSLQPREGDRVGDLAWKRVTLKGDDPWAFGQVELAWLDLSPHIGGYKINQVAFAHTYLYAARPGKVRAVIDHGHGLQAWLNGKTVYESPERGMVLGSYVAISRFDFGLSSQSSPRFDLDLTAGWNRLTFKISACNKPGWTDIRFSLRLMDPPDVPYESKNIAWMTPLPNRSNATPIVVGDRIFVMSEPDELICLDKHSGQIRWSAATNYYEALSEQEKQAQPAYQEKIEPLLAQLRQEKEPAKRLDLRREIHKRLTDIDSARFTYDMDGHFEAHFGIVGFTTPTPVSDGQHVWVWCGNGVAACYDLHGQRRWITRVAKATLTYASSPALANGVLAVFLDKLYGLDAKTGKILWAQRKVNRNQAAILPARLAGTEVFIGQQGDIVRPADGHLLWSMKNRIPGDTGWAAPVIQGDVVYLPRFGVNQLYVIDCTGVGGDTWNPKVRNLEVSVISRRGGKWVDRWMAGSPLLVDGIDYSIDIYATLYAVEVQTGKTLYRQDLDMQGLFHYNAVPVAASPTLCGRYIYLLNNQGTTLVIEPGRQFKQVARNRLAAQLDRRWSIPPQETISNAPPVPDGNRLLIRGERYLYCVGERKE